MNPTPLKHLRHKKAWTLSEVSKRLSEQGTPCSFPTLVNIDRGFKKNIIRDSKGNKIKESKKKYSPNRRTLADIAKLFKVDATLVYDDRSKD